VRAELSAAGAAGVPDVGQSELTAWDALHQQIRKLDDSGSWTQAVDIATGRSQQAFDAFAAKNQAALTTQANAVASGLESGHTLLVVLGWVTLLVGLLAAAAAAAGVGERMREYR
jgi:hypothetical protein